MKSLFFVVFIFLTTAYAARVSFKVIAPDAKNTVHVNINEVLVELKASDPDIPYYTGFAELKHGQSYNYVVDGNAESFKRLLNGSSTKNEFFNRPVTYATNIPELPSILTEGSWTRGDTSNPIWDSNYVPSIFVTGNPREMKELIENVKKNTYKTKITFIGPETINTFEGCTFGLHKPGRKHNDAKQSWIWALPEGQFMANRNWFKIRHMEEDPTQLREKLYADILRKMGTYANEANMVRFFINKEGMGIFNMLDDVIMYSYINAMFYNGDTPEQFGGLYDGASGASFNFPGDFDSFVPNVESPLDQDAIQPFSKAFTSIDFLEDEQVKTIGKYFDYDQFLRFMVMEFLTGDWDGYWQEQTNDGAYIDINDHNKIYYLGQDFDATFGVNLEQKREFVNMSYTEYPKMFPGGVLINRLLQNPGVKKTFENYLKITVQEIFNNATLGPYVTARHEFLAPDLYWDRSIKQRSPGNVFGWTFEQTYENLFEGVTAPGKNSGGADWGLLEWVAAKEKAVKSYLSSSEAADAATVTQVPEAPGTDSTPSKSNTWPHANTRFKQAEASNTHKIGTSSPSNFIVKIKQGTVSSSSSIKRTPCILSLIILAGTLFASFL
ncbi:hypothetical protein G6F57_003424 [Rhizopus arrhizus]|uniref:Coth-domain-containing protein n=1 Tax=Rhizopus oryzae TaxID=64495 RepID=A0A9P7BY34_RHIOR|nr:hypothetical protein G6F24_001773 [Rhizopus arrhizus]KAG1426352.1 hypothetical protein G6F58_001522 [Rhizopus delemar]KAG0797221.1 hypothetical protein G6F21_000695 [Rhizopus arrhizus]KAG0816630.1 hypothetical protein G6F20_003045 [Rhizopus arrhizus]KAG0842088.1 hypothetical protein G6F18_002951 [Rhizopus arrhizus]